MSFGVMVEFPMGVLSLEVVQDCVFGGKHHGGALALEGRFRPTIDYGCITEPPTYGQPFI